MTLGLLFWIIMIFWFFFGFFRENPALRGYGPIGYNGLLFLVLFILGWKVFGFVIQP
jgi:hypothetical protein